VLAGVQKLHLSELQKLVLQVMETHLQAGELTEMDALFAELDVQHDGFIRRDELQQVMKSRNIGLQTGTHLDVVFGALDLQGTGAISLHEFRAAALAQRQQLMHALMRPVFTHLDLGSNGTISAAEMVRVITDLGLSSVTEEQVSALIAEFDHTQTGELGFADFRKMMSNVTEDYINTTDLEPNCE